MIKEITVKRSIMILKVTKFIGLLFIRKKKYYWLF